MRQIILDTETTGLHAHAGDRIVEIGCVELYNRRLTGHNFHFYINPERDSAEAALAVHGLTRAFLQDKPKFAAIAKEFLNYVRDAEVIIHNAAFDVSFLDAEFQLLGWTPFQKYVATIIDSLQIARELHPGLRNSLDALCDRYGINNKHRTLHGGLLDATLLAEVYLAMTRGQNALPIDLANDDHGADIDDFAAALSSNKIIIAAASAQELQAHEAILDDMEQRAKKTCIWRSR